MTMRFAITDESARFEVYQSEYLGIDMIALEQYQTKLKDLTIGRAASLLQIFALGPLMEISDNDPNSPNAQIVERQISSVEACLLHSVKTTGRIVIDIMANDDEGQYNARPVETIEITGDAWLGNQPTLSAS